MRKSKRIIKQHYSRQASNSLLCADFSIQENQQFEFLFWGEYYFMKLQFGFKATYISMTFPISSFLGAITLNPLVNRFPRQVSFLTSLLMTLCLLSSVLSLLLNPDKSELPYYMIIFFVYFYFWITPFSKTLTN